MIRETLYTSIGAAALAVDFATNASKQQNWLKKAERRGSKLARTSELQLRKVNKQVESVVEDVTKSSLNLLGLAEDNVEKTAKSTTHSARSTARKVRRRTPKARVSRRTRRTGGRRVTSTTVSLSQAS
ncbi:MAG: hypothetical protein QOE92_1285 [Chloroflexota bacterium]|nr:hypothetical protein [Chloroflexota bacterium]